MVRKITVGGILITVCLLAAPGVAHAYPPPAEPTIDVLTELPDIRPGQPVTVRVDNFLPASEADFTVSADGVDGAGIGLTVMGSKSVHVQVGTDGSFTVQITFPEAATYTLTADGLDVDGNPTSVSVTLEVSELGGLPGTGFGGRDLGVAGGALVAAGIAALVLARRRSTVLR
jgi:hypothetical protein